MLNEENPQAKRIIWPWSEGQVSELNRWQARDDRVFKCMNAWCGNHAKPTKLVATEQGWCCPVCDYQQDWAYAYMAMSDNMVTWGVDCESCARLLDSCYDETARAEKAEDQVKELEAQLEEFREAKRVRNW